MSEGTLSLLMSCCLQNTHSPSACFDVLAGAQGWLHVHHLQAGKAGGQDMGRHVRHGRGAQVAGPHADCRPQGSTRASLWQAGLPACPAPPCLWALATQGMLLLLSICVQYYAVATPSLLQSSLLFKFTHCNHSFAL